MSKTLSNILTIFKVAKIVAKVVFILCIIGAAGCLLGLVTLPLLGPILPMEVLAEEGVDFATAYLSCFVGLVACAGEIVAAFLAERYFGHVLKAGTPFTFDGAKESFRLGIATIIISFATSVLSGIVFAIFLLISPNLSEVDVSASVSLSTGLFFLFLSLIFKHGAELQGSAEEASKQEEPASKSETL